MPGEERKFNRRTMVAFVPTCKRERESAASHADAIDVESDSKVVVGEARRVGVGSAGCVSVGDGVCEGGSEMDVGEAGTGVGFAVSRCSVTAGSAEEGAFKALVENKVGVDPTDCEGDRLIKIKKRISKKMATVNLKRS